MKTSSAGDEAAIQGAWRELVALEGEGLEAYGRSLKEFGQGTLSSTAFVRDVLDLTARETAEAVRISLQLATDFYRLGWSLLGVRLNPSEDETAESTTQPDEAAQPSDPASPLAKPH